MRFSVWTFCLTSVVFALPAAAAPPEQNGWWRSSDLIDYGIIAGSLGVFEGLHLATPLESAGIGPRFDPQHPASILDPVYSDRIGRKYLVEDKQETVPALWVGLAIPVVAGWLALQEGLPANRDARHLHDTLVGFGEAMSLTLMTTEVLKFSFGRLRPDFQDRVRRYYCNRPDHADVDCAGLNEGPLSEDPSKIEKIWADSRRSFPSGHASTSFALATYAALVTGGHFVWGKEATDTTRAWGIPLQAAVLSLAAFVAWSRVNDGRHNLSDVLTGAALGTAMANLAYWRRFDTAGHSRNSDFAGTAMSLTGGPAGATGVGLLVRF